MGYRYLVPDGKSHILLIVIGVCFFGCASTKIESVVDPNFTGTVDRLYVLIDSGRLDAIYSDALDKAFTETLSERKVEFRTRIVEEQKDEPLKLEPDLLEYFHEAESFKPDAVLIVRLSVAELWEIGVFSNFADVKYDASLLIPGRERRAWRATIKTRTHANDRSKERKMEEVVQKIVKQLVTDGLLMQ